MNIGAMKDEELLQLFKNAGRILSNGPNAKAESVVADIELEWKRRIDLARVGQYTYQSPSEGMLATLGYHVGNTEGESTPIRRLILKHLMERQLPLVKSPIYTDEWGTPNSPKRYYKLIRVLESQLTNPHAINAPNMARAMIEWSEDLDWVQKTFSHLAR